MGKYNFRVDGKVGLTENGFWVIQCSKMNTLGKRGPCIELISSGEKTYFLTRGMHFLVANKRASSNQIFYFIYYLMLTKRSNHEII